MLDGSVRSVTGFNHVALVTADIDRLVEFYSDVFGLEVALEMHDDHRHALLRVGAESFLHAFEVPASAHTTSPGSLFERGHLDHVAFTAPDEETFEAIRERLVVRGASDGAVTDFGIGRSLYFVDPDEMSCEVLVMSHADLALATAHGEPLTTSVE
jgi:catechol 2,3-dioxygenase-like lactoylglutathione lyase family enzyme